MAQLRRITTEFLYADFSTSISPAVELALEERKAGSTALINFFRGSSFTSGVVDDPEKSLDLAFCRKERIVVRRRQNGGGAIYGPDGGVFIVLYLDTRLPWVPVKTIEQAFPTVLTALAGTIRELFGIEAVYRPVNDVEVEGRKLVPTSARLEKGILTMRLLVNVVPTDPNVLKNAIITPPEKVQDKKIKDPGARFTCLEKEAGRRISPSELERLAAETVEKIFGTDIALVPAELTDIERGYAMEYQKQYTSDQWFYANSERTRFKTIPTGTVKSEGRHKAPAGLIRVTLLVRNRLMEDLIITGDFHPSPMGVLKEMEDVLRGSPCGPDIVEEKIGSVLKRPDVEIAGTTVRDFVAAFQKAFEGANKQL